MKISRGWRGVRQVREQINFKKWEIENHWQVVYVTITSILVLAIVPNKFRGNE